MNDEFRHDGLQALWQSQSPGDAAISLDDVRSRARQLETRIARRNLREYIAATVLVAGYGPVIWLGPNATLRVGAALLVAATVFIVYHLKVRGTALTLPADLALTDALDLHRAQLLRQVTLLKGVWLWALMPLAPGMALVLIGLARAKPEQASFFAGAGVVTVIMLFAIYLLNRRGAARAQGLLDRLNERI